MLCMQPSASSEVEDIIKDHIQVLIHTHIHMVSKVSIHIHTQGHPTTVASPTNGSPELNSPSSTTSESLDSSFLSALVPLPLWAKWPLDQSGSKRPNLHREYSRGRLRDLFSLLFWGLYQYITPLKATGSLSTTTKEEDHIRDTIPIPTEMMIRNHGGIHKLAAFRCLEKMTTRILNASSVVKNGATTKITRNLDGGAKAGGRTKRKT